MEGSQQSELKKRRPWTKEDDQKLMGYMNRHDNDETRKWRDVAKFAELNRPGKSCRERWTKYLRPDIKRGDFSQHEETTITRLQSEHGNKWAFISAHFPGRTDQDIKNYWNSRLKKKKKLLETPLVTQAPILTPDEILASGYGFSDAKTAQLPNLHFPHNPLQGFHLTDPTQTLSNLPPQGPILNYYEPQFNPTDQTLPSLPPQGPGLDFNPTYPAQTLPNIVAPQGHSLNYQAMEDPTINNYRDQFCPLIANMPNTGLITDPQVKEYPNDNTRLKKKKKLLDTPFVTHAPILTPDYILASGYGFSDAKTALLPNLHFPHNPLQGFHLTDPTQTLPNLPPQGPILNYYEPQFNPTDQTLPSLPPQGPGLDFNPTYPAQTLPNTVAPQGHSLNYQAMEDPTINNYRDQFCPLIANMPNTGLIPDPQVNKYPSDNTRLKKKKKLLDTPFVTHAPILTPDDILASGYGFLDAKTAQLPNLHFPHNPLQGFHLTDPTQTLPNLPPQGPILNYYEPQFSPDFNPTYTLPNTVASQGHSLNYQAMEDPTVNNYGDQFCPLIANMPNTDSSPEFSVINQVGNDTEPPYEEIFNRTSTTSG